ncbi:hypothetical protein BV22DRAFT_1022465, partial [Leucogyrophana mollusca]
MWTVHKYLTSEPAEQVRSRIPTLKAPGENAPHNGPQDNARKSELLYNTFFRGEPDGASAAPDQQYPPPVCSFVNITNAQIHRAIKKLAPYKAPGPNGVSNSVFTHTADLLVPYLGPIFRATFTLQVYPEQWKHSATIVLRKPGRPDYSLPKAYRPITLLDTMAKIL